MGFAKIKQNIELKLLVYLALFFTVAIFPQFLEAQSYRYMDNSGNIIFKYKLLEVPMKYRNQIPGYSTPAPVVTGKAKNKRGTKATSHTRPTKAPKAARVRKPKKARNSKRRIEGPNNYIEERPNYLPQVTAAAAPTLLPTIAAIEDIKKMIDQGK